MQQQPQRPSATTAAESSNSAATSSSCNRWSTDVYDYDAQQIVDAEASDIDVQSGWWVRCDSCRGRKYKMRQPFDTSMWNAHKQTVSHTENAARLRNRKQIDQELPKRASVTSNRSRRGRSASVCPSESATRQQVVDAAVASAWRCTQHERNVSNKSNSGVLVNVIDSLSSLVSEQQDDIHDLQSKLRTMHREMAKIVSAFHDVHDSQLQLSQSVVSYLEGTTSQASDVPPMLMSPSPSQPAQARRLRSWSHKSRPSHDRRRHVPHIIYDDNDTEDTDDSSATDMSIDDDRSQLTEME